MRCSVDSAELADGEVVWATPVGDGRFQVDNIPLLVFGVSLGDIVEGRTTDSELELVRVVAHGGHSTYRLMFADRDDPSSQHLFREILDLGCGFEELTPRYVTVDVPRNVDVHAVYDLLEQGLQRAVWTFEEGHCGHPLGPRR